MRSMRRSEVEGWRLELGAPGLEAREVASSFSETDLQPPTSNLRSV